MEPPNPGYLFIYVFISFLEWLETVTFKKNAVSIRFLVSFWTINTIIYDLNKGCVKFIKSESEDLHTLLWNKCWSFELSNQIIMNQTH